MDSILFIFIYSPHQHILYLILAEEEHFRHQGNYTINHSLLQNRRSKNLGRDTLCSREQRRLVPILCSEITVWLFIIISFLTVGFFKVAFRIVWKLFYLSPVDEAIVGHCLVWPVIVGFNTTALEIRLYLIPSRLNDSIVPIIHWILSDID